MRSDHEGVQDASGVGKSAVFTGSSVWVEQLGAKRLTEISGGMGGRERG